MHLIKVDATDSTNSLARQWWKENQRNSMACIWALNQLQGRGQRGTIWNAQAGQNLTFSVVVPYPEISLPYQFLLSACVATSIATVLQNLALPKITVKWPNDIMAGNSKVGGILIENIITQNKYAAAIVGIGLNVNQQDFSELPNAGSLRMASGREFDLEALLNLILNQLETDLGQIKDEYWEAIMKHYKGMLFRINCPSTFELPSKQLFTGVITDVRLDGKLVVQTQDDQLRNYDIKEIRLRY